MKCRRQLLSKGSSGTSLRSMVAGWRRLVSLMRLLLFKRCRLVTRLCRTLRPLLYLSAVTRKLLTLRRRKYVRKYRRTTVRYRIFRWSAVRRSRNLFSLDRMSRLLTLMSVERVPSRRVVKRSRFGGLLRPRIPRAYLLLLLIRTALCRRLYLIVLYRLTRSMRVLLD